MTDQLPRNPLHTALAAATLAACVAVAACSPSERPTGALTASLHPGALSDSLRLNWSPKAAAVSLELRNDGLEGEMHLGSPEQQSFRVRLEKADGSAYYNVLAIDANRDGQFEDSEKLMTEPKEIRHKMWSSFETELTVDVTDSTTGKVVSNPYPIPLWYVEDPANPEPESALRFTRSGWMEGRIFIDSVDAYVRVSESLLDGQFTLDDEWGLALPDSAANLYSYKHDRPARRHAWLGEQAYRIVSLSRTGRSITIEPIDPGVTRAQEAIDDDQMAVDRRAPRSGDVVAFGHDFAAAEAESKASGKPLFIDFETVWCGPCKSMDEWVYTADSVVAASRGLVAVKVDGDDFPDLAKRFEVAGYPTMLIVSPDGAVADRLVGYQGVEAMAAFLGNRGVVDS